MFKAVKLIAVIGGLVLSFAAAEAQAYNLVANGGFDTAGGNGQIGYNTTVADWTTSGYNFVFAPGTATTTGAPTQFGGTNLTLWGTDIHGNSNGFTDSPDGGNFIGADGAFEVGAITQTLTGLVAGQQYSVGFDYAGAQQSGFTGPTTESWIVNLGNNNATAQSTPILSDSSQGFTGWNHEVFTFTADGSSDTLSFLAAGTPNGEPPFSLLDGVTMVAVPEPASMLLMGTGLAALGLVRRRRRAAQ